jgi:peptide/nickel transport system ATP-binding protein
MVEGRTGRASRCFFWEKVPAPDAVAAEPAGAARRTVDGGTAVLEAHALTHQYGMPGRRLVPVLGAPPLRALDNVSLTVGGREALAIIGESGSGKTTLGRCLVGLLQPTAGSVTLRGYSLPRRPEQWTRSTRRHIQMVFQNPDLTLNPRRTVFEAVARPLELFGGGTREDRRRRAAALLEAVKLGPRYLDRLPHQLSGGERQRVAIARAFAADPDAVVCDEPTSALDVSVQAAILNLLAVLQDSRGVAYVFISHDLSVVRHLADRVMVIYRGSVVEEGPTDDVFASPRHAYTKALLAAVPTLRARSGP